MVLSKDEIIKRIREWLIAWDEYDIDRVMEIMHDDVVFENWTDSTISGKNKLKKSWTLWFNNHGNFKFTEEGLFVDEHDQKALFQWKLEWPSLEKHYKGEKEIRRGIDVIHFLDGKIYRKYSYSKTTILIDNHPVTLSAQK
jgi:ketosteroid isomerase-like protein